MNKSFSDAIIKLALERKERVCIFRTTETGEIKWAVELIELRDFWLDTFDTEDEAIEYCNKYELGII
jgi:hypothetical protein